LKGEAILSNGTAFGMFYVMWNSFMYVEKVKASNVATQIVLETIAGPIVGIFVGLVLQFIVDRIYD
jgi:NhaP-type Na+/H+ or K+/H+ antiporter